MQGDWFGKYGISTAGLMVRDEHTAVSRVVYSADGERVETPPYGLSHYRKMEAVPEDLAAVCGGAKGVYIFKDFGPDGYWDAVLALKKQHGFALMWELNADIAQKDCADRIHGIAGQIDILTLNRTEAANLLGTQTPQQSAAALQSWGVPAVYLRCGSEGALYITPRQIWQIPPVPNANVVDPTGGGNSSSAAVLYAYCEGMRPLECGIVGSISAAACIAQYGPPALDAAARQRALELKKQMLPGAGG